MNEDQVPPPLPPRGQMEALSAPSPPLPPRPRVTSRNASSTHADQAPPAELPKQRAGARAATPIYGDPASPSGPPKPTVPVWGTPSMCEDLAPLAASPRWQTDEQAAPPMYAYVAPAAPPPKPEVAGADVPPTYADLAPTAPRRNRAVGALDAFSPACVHLTPPAPSVTPSAAALYALRLRADEETPPARFPAPVAVDDARPESADLAPYTDQAVAARGVPPIHADRAPPQLSPKAALPARRATTPGAGRAPPMPPPRPNPRPDIAGQTPRYRASEGGGAVGGLPARAGVHFATRSRELPPNEHGVPDNGGSGGGGGGGGSQYSMGGSGGGERGDRDGPEEDDVLNDRLEELEKKRDRWQVVEYAVNAPAYLETMEGVARMAQHGANAVHQGANVGEAIVAGARHGGSAGPGLEMAGGAIAVGAHAGQNIEQVSRITEGAAAAGGEGAWVTGEASAVGEEGAQIAEQAVATDGVRIAGEASAVGGDGGAQLTDHVCVVGGETVLAEQAGATTTAEAVANPPGTWEAADGVDAGAVEMADGAQATEFAAGGDTIVNPEGLATAEGLADGGPAWTDVGNADVPVDEEVAGIIVEGHQYYSCIEGNCLVTPVEWLARCAVDVYGYLGKILCRCCCCCLGGGENTAASREVASAADGAACAGEEVLGQADGYFGWIWQCFDLSDLCVLDEALGYALPCCGLLFSLFRLYQGSTLSCRSCLGMYRANTESMNGFKWMMAEGQARLWQGCCGLIGLAPGMIIITLPSILAFSLVAKKARANRHGQDLQGSAASVADVESGEVSVVTSQPLPFSSPQERKLFYDQAYDAVSGLASDNEEIPQYIRESGLVPKNEYPAVPRGEWSSGVFGCFEHVPSCVTTCLCMCITAGQVAEGARLFKYVFYVTVAVFMCGSVGAPGGVLWVLFGTYVVAVSRARIAKEYGIPIRPVANWCLSLWCNCCVAAQVARHLFAWGKNTGRWTGWGEWGPKPESHWCTPTRKPVVASSAKPAGQAYPVPEAHNGVHAPAAVAPVVR